MIGTPKQVAWATTLREPLLGRWRAAAAAEAQRVAGLVERHPHLGIKRDVLAALVAAAERQDQARFWIDSQSGALAFSLDEINAIVAQVGRGVNRLTVINTSHQINVPQLHEGEQ